MINDKKICGRSLIGECPLKNCLLKEKFYKNKNEQGRPIFCYGDSVMRGYERCCVKEIYIPLNKNNEFVYLVSFGLNENMGQLVLESELQRDGNANK